MWKFHLKTADPKFLIKILYSLIKIFFFFHYMACPHFYIFVVNFFYFIFISVISKIISKVLYNYILINKIYINVFVSAFTTPLAWDLNFSIVFKIIRVDSLRFGPFFLNKMVSYGLEQFFYTFVFFGRSKFDYGIIFFG